MLREIFSDEGGHLSSTRVMGFIGWVCGIVLAFLGKSTEANSIMAASASLLGIGQIKSAVVKTAKAKAAKPEPPKPEPKKETPNASRI